VKKGKVIEMECACIYVDAEHDYSGFQKIRMVTARIYHICDECHCVIEPRTKYELVTGMADGEFFSNKTCPECLSIRNVLFCSGWFWGCVIDDLINFISDTDADFLNDKIFDLTEKARWKLFEYIEDYWKYNTD